jgi:hypothetical protein
MATMVFSLTGLLLAAGLSGRNDELWCPKKKSQRFAHRLL